jgi:rRNA-processing protein FCF1
MTVTLIPDTNCFLHYSFPLEIDWRALLGDDDVGILVPTSVLRELDRAKFEKPAEKIRERAAKALRQIERALDAGTGAPYPLTVLPTEPRSEEFPEDFDHRVVDDRILYVARLQLVHGRVVIATGDTTMKIRARHFGLEVCAIPKKYMKPAALAPKQVQTPRLRFEAERIAVDVPSFEVPEPVRARAIRWLSRHYPRRRDSVPDMTTHDPLPMLRAIERGLEDPARNKRYNRRLDAFFSEVREYFQDLEDHRRTRAKLARIALTLSNDGVVPATDISIFLEVPVGFRVLESLDGLSKEPEKPTAPTDLDVGVDLTQIARPRFDFGRFPYINRPMSIIERDGAPTEVRFDYGKLQQTLRIEMTEFFLLPTCELESVLNVRIPYTIVADELPKPIIGELLVSWSRRERHWNLGIVRAGKTRLRDEEVRRD